MACCDLLECSICLSAFRDPHILPRCGHTFCLSCIQPLRDSRCPICRQVFDRRNVRPNFVVQQLLLEGNGVAHSCAGSASAGRPLRPSHAGHEHRHGSTREVAAAYEGLGVPPKLADVLAEEDADIALRVYILDNSGSMAAGDGHVMHVDAGGRMRSVPATRWEEVKAMAVQHADWNAQLDVPCEFILLNSPSPSHPTDGVDYVRVDSDHGSVATQQRRLADLLARTRPNMGTPLTERLHDLLFRLRGNVQELQKNGQKVMVTIVTDGAPNGPRQNFVDALRQLTLQVPAFLVIRLCTDENAVTEFYDGIDKEVELSLDIIDDLHGEANNVYRMNPWLTYTPVLQKVREAGTLSKILDFVDERPLLPMEVAVVTQLLLRPATSSQYPRNPEAFLTAVEQELGDAAPVFSGRTNCMSPPVDLRTLKAAVLPQKYSAVGQVAHAVGLGGVADWFFTGKNPFTAAREDSENEDAHTTAPGHAALVARSTFIVGQQIEYYSTTKACWYGCNIMQVDSAGSVMVSVKPGQWIPPAQQSTCIRLPSASPGAPAGPPADAVLSGVELIEYRSQSLRCWLPCMVVQRDASSGNVMTNLKPGEWLTPQQQADSIRPFDRHAKPATLHVGQAVVYHSRCAHCHSGSRICLGANFLPSCASIMSFYVDGDEENLPRLERLRALSCGESSLTPFLRGFQEGGFVAERQQFVRHRATAFKAVCVDGSHPLEWTQYHREYRDMYERHFDTILGSLAMSRDEVNEYFAWLHQNAKFLDDDSEDLYTFLDALTSSEDYEEFLQVMFTEVRKQHAQDQSPHGGVWRRLEIEEVDDIEVVVPPGVSAGQVLPVHYMGLPYKVPADRIRIDARLPPDTSLGHHTT